MVLYKKKGGRFGQKADLDEILRVNIYRKETVQVYAV